MDESFLKISDRTFLDGIARYAAAEAFRGKSLLDTLTKVMGIWVSFGLKLIPKGDRQKIHSYLMAKPGGKSKKGRLRKWRERVAARLTEWLGLNTFNTLGRPGRPHRRRATAKVPELAGKRVCAIVSALDIYYARRQARGRFYTLARRFLRRRESSANTLRGGLIDPLRKLKKRAPGDGARHKHSPHDLQQKAAADFAMIAVDTWASARKTRSNRRPLGVKGKAGDVFMRTMGSLHKMVEEWTSEKMIRAARDSGLASPAPP